MRSDSTTKTRPKQSDAPILPLAQSLRLAVMRLARRLRQQSEPDMTPSMLSALSTIERHGPMTLRELAVHERVQPPTVTTVLGRLENAGLIEKCVCGSYTPLTEDVVRQVHEPAVVERVRHAV